MPNLITRLPCSIVLLLASLSAFANSPAIWSVAAPRNIDTYVSGQVLASPSDPDGPIIMASLINGTLPNGATLQNSSGQVFISNLALLTPGTFGSSIRTIDALGVATTRSISIRIMPDAEAIVDIRPVGSRDEYTVGDTLLSFSDQDGTITSAKIISGNLPLGTAFDTLNGTVTVSNLALLQTGDWSFTIATTDQTGGKTTTPVNFRFTPYGPLPVTLTSFQAKREAAQVLLKWQTASEKDNDRFEVERSSDGRIFRKIGSVQGSHTTASASEYQFTDRQPLVTRSYYRLRQVDLDGSFSYSPVVWVKAQETQPMAAAFPNPTTGITKLLLPASGLPNGPTLVYDLSGRLVKEISFSNELQPQIDLSHFPNGTYLLRVQSGQDFYTIPLQKFGY